MPESECIAFARFGEDDSECGASLRGRCASGIELRESFAQFRWSVFEIGRAGT